MNDNAYKVDLLGEYGVSATFNISDLTKFDVYDEDSRSNPFKQRVDVNPKEKNKGCLNCKLTTWQIKVKKFMHMVK